MQLAALNREYRIAEETYSRLHAAVEQARVDEKVTTNAGALRIVDLARRAQGPVTKGPSPGQLIALGLVLSLGLGLGLAIGLDALDARLKTTEDVQRLLELPVTGVIPAMSGRVRKAPAPGDGAGARPRPMPRPTASCAPTCSSPPRSGPSRR